MKNVWLILASALLLSCGAKKEKEKESEKKSEEVKETEEVSTGNEGDYLCYQSTSPCEKDPLEKQNCLLKVSIQGDQVKANTLCEGCTGIVEHFYRGVKHEDTLLLDEILGTKDGKETLKKTFWIMAGDQLNQLVTMEKNGKTILKEQTTHTFAASYVKSECE